MRNRFLLLLLILFLGIPQSTLALSPGGERWLETTIREFKNSEQSPLQGGWYGFADRDELILFFMHNVCALRLKGQTKYGTWRLEGRKLDLMLSDRNLTFSARLEGNRLFLDDLVLERYRKETTAKPVIPGFGDNGTTLTGHWVYKAAFGEQEFIFTNQAYMFLVNGREVERGTYSLNDEQMNYQITSGAKQGVKGTMRVKRDNDLLIVTQGNGAVTKFRKK